MVGGAERQARAVVGFREVLRELADAVGAENGDEVGGTATGGREDGAVQPAAELLGELAPALQVAVVGVQGAAAALAGVHAQPRHERSCGAAHPGKERSLVAAEHELRPISLAAARAASHQPHRPQAPRAVGTPQQRLQPDAASTTPVPRVVAPLLEQRAVLNARGADGLASAAPQTERGLFLHRRVVVG